MAFKVYHGSDEQPEPEVDYYFKLRPSASGLDLVACDSKGNPLACGLVASISKRGIRLMVAVNPLSGLMLDRFGQAVVRDCDGALMTASEDN